MCLEGAHGDIFAFYLYPCTAALPKLSVPFGDFDFAPVCIVHRRMSASAAIASLLVVTAQS